MPSIPQSLLWISLVVLWLFVLVPMLISKRDTVRRTSDVALATRVLTSGGTARLLKRSGPAAGHRSDPHWRADDRGKDTDQDADQDSLAEPGSSVMVVAPPSERMEPDYLDVDVVDEDSGALPVGASADAEVATEVAAELEKAPPAGTDEDAEYETEDLDEDDVPESDADADEYEYVEDTSGLEAEEESPIAMASVAAPGASRRRRYDSSTAAAVSARKYTFRKRVLMAMALVLVLSAVMAFTVTSTAWWFCGIATGVTVLYLAYLRRQTRIEEQIRARRMKRMARSRYEAERADDRRVDVVSSRLHRPGAAVLEIDDEDPAFAHLDYASFARDHDWRRDLPRAAGE